MVGAISLDEASGAVTLLTMAREGDPPAVAKMGSAMVSGGAVVSSVPVNTMKGTFAGGKSCV